MNRYYLYKGALPCQGCHQDDALSWRKACIWLFMSPICRPMSCPPRAVAAVAEEKGKCPKGAAIIAGEDWKVCLGKVKEESLSAWPRKALPGALSPTKGEGESPTLPTAPRSTRAGRRRPSHSPDPSLFSPARWPYRTSTICATSSPRASCTSAKRFWASAPVRVRMVHSCRTARSSILRLSASRVTAHPPLRLCQSRLQLVQAPLLLGDVLAECRRLVLQVGQQTIPLLQEGETPNVPRAASSSSGEGCDSPRPPVTPCRPRQPGGSPIPLGCRCRRGPR